MQTSYDDDVCLVLLVLSLGCQYALESDIDHNVQQGSQQAEAYFQRARAAFHYDPLDVGDTNHTTSPNIVTHGSILEEHRKYT